MKRLTKSPFLKEWATMGQVAVKPGIANGKAQIVIGRVPMEAESLDKLNVDLFD